MPKLSVVASLLSTLTFLGLSTVVNAEDIANSGGFSGDAKVGFIYIYW